MHQTIRVHSLTVCFGLISVSQLAGLHLSLFSDSHIRANNGTVDLGPTTIWISNRQHPQTSSDPGCTYPSAMFTKSHTITLDSRTFFPITQCLPITLFLIELRSPIREVDATRESADTWALGSMFEPDAFSESCLFRCRFSRLGGIVRKNCEWKLQTTILGATFLTERTSRQSAQ